MLIYTCQNQGNIYGDFLMFSLASYITQMCFYNKHCHSLFEKVLSTTCSNFLKIDDNMSPKIHLSDNKRSWAEILS